MSVTINGTGNTITPVTVNTTGSVNGITPQASNMQPFNRIINGAMTIDQRNAGASVTPTNGQYVIDRWKQYQSVASKYSVQQNAGGVTPPAGFANYLGVVSLSSYTSSSNDYFTLEQTIEGYNVADLGWGTADAESVTASFWVRSSLTGTFGGSIKNKSSSADRSYPFSFVISVANTWEQKTITVIGDTTGTWLNTNGLGITLSINLGTDTTYSGTAGSWAGTNYLSATGATSVVGTSGATFYITGVQLEAGSTASPFAHENYGDTLQKCQRYYYSISEAQLGEGLLFGIGTFYDGSDLRVIVNLPVTMRATPTIESSSTTNDFRLINNGGSDYFTGIGSAGGNFRTAAHLYKAGVSGTGGQSGILMTGGTGVAYIGFRSEL